MVYLAGHDSRFNCGRILLATAAMVKNKNAIDVGRYTPALPTHCFAADADANLPLSLLVVAVVMMYC
jgi:hypothetical protein